jgi:hypothetical protein
MMGKNVNISFKSALWPSQAYSLAFTLLKIIRDMQIFASVVIIYKCWPIGNNSTRLIIELSELKFNHITIRKMF